MWLRIFTLEEALALLPEVRRLADETRQVHGEWREAAEHRDDLRIVWGDDVVDPECEAHEEFVTRSAHCDRLAARLKTQLGRFRELGVELKDPELGLVDFHALNGDQLVYLCWRLGEETISSWHTLQGGFAGRRALPDLTGSEPTA